MTHSDQASLLVTIALDALPAEEREAYLRSLLAAVVAQIGMGEGYRAAAETCYVYGDACVAKAMMGRAA